MCVRRQAFVYDPLVNWRLVADPRKMRNGRRRRGHGARESPAAEGGGAGSAGGSDQSSGRGRHDGHDSSYGVLASLSEPPGEGAMEGRPGTVREQAHDQGRDQVRERTRQRAGLGV